MSNRAAFFSANDESTEKVARRRHAHTRNARVTAGRRPLPAMHCCQSYYTAGCDTAPRNGPIRRGLPRHVRLPNARRRLRRT
ncbi:unnamed protein product, partial [Iphiclides podalirius]